MASPVRNAPGTVIHRLQDAPWRFDFFAAVLWLERLKNSRQVPSPDVATSLSPNLESIHFRTSQQHVYAASDLVQVTAFENDGKAPDWNLTVNMMGLTGVNGVLPSVYSRMVLDQLKAADETRDSTDYDRKSALPDFFDLLNHRQISLFYRAWKKYRLEASYSRHIAVADFVRDDPITSVLFSLVGMATGRHDRPQALRNRSNFSDDDDDEAIIYYSGAFAAWPRSPQTLKDILTDMFGLEVEFLEFQPQWSNLSRSDQFQMSNGTGTSREQPRLGQSIVIGSRICLYESRFRLRFGPLNREQFDRLLPDRDLFHQIVRFIRIFAGPQWDFDLQLVLKRSDVPRSKLGLTQLGRNGWMLNEAAASDQDQLVLIPNELKDRVPRSNNVDRPELV